jgi:hypothetical protein
VPATQQKNSLDVPTDWGSYGARDSVLFSNSVLTDRSDRDTCGSALIKKIDHNVAGSHSSKQRHDYLAVLSNSSQDNVSCIVQPPGTEGIHGDCASTIRLSLIDKRTIDMSSLCLLEVEASNCLPGSELLVSGYDAHSGLFIEDSFCIVNKQHKVPILFCSINTHPVTLGNLNNFKAEYLYTSVDNIFSLDAVTEFNPWPEGPTETVDIKPIEVAFDLSHLDPDIKALVMKLLREYEDIFVHGKVGLGCTDVVEHHIDVQGGTPVKKRI